MQQAALLINNFDKTGFLHRELPIKFTMRPATGKHTECLLHHKGLRLLAQVRAFFAVKRCSALMRSPACPCPLLSGWKRNTYLHISIFLSTLLLPVFHSVHNHYKSPDGSQSMKEKNMVL